MAGRDPIRRYHSGAIPFQVEIMLDSYDGPGWVKQQLRGRAGWLQVSRARMSTPVSEWSAILVAGWTDDHQRLSKISANALLSMRSSGPEVVHELPPPELDEITEMLFWDFLGWCDVRHLGMLSEAEQDRDTRVAREQERGTKVLADADVFIADMNRRRRDPATPSETRAGLIERIAFFEEKQAAAAEWLVRRLAKIRREYDEFEADALAALQNHGELEELYTARWLARYSRDARFDREREDSFFQGPNRPARANRTAEAFLASARQHDFELADERSARLERARAARRRAWAERIQERARQEQERALAKRAADRQFEEWEKAQRELMSIRAAPEKPAAPPKLEGRKTPLTSAQARSAAMRRQAKEDAEAIDLLVRRYRSPAEIELQITKEQTRPNRDRHLEKLMRQAIRKLIREGVDPAPLEEADVDG